MRLKSIDCYWYITVKQIILFSIDGYLSSGYINTEINFISRLLPGKKGYLKFSKLFAFNPVEKF